MRLRSRRRAPQGDGWVSASGALTRTPIGNLDSPERAAVDPAGLVAFEGSGWSLDWWIGAEDRWHVPAREAAVRQTLLGASPVVETRVRVPGGDAVHRCYGARGPAGEDVVVVEVHNDSKLPFAVALSMRPYGLDGEGHLDRVELDGAEVVVDAVPVLRLPRSPGRVALATGAEGDAAAVVFAGEAERVRRREVDCRDGLATAALLFPLAHTATLRVVLSPGGGLVAADELPSAEQVVSGWAAHSREGARFEVPDRRLRDAAAASTRFLLLEAAGIRDAGALDLLGFHDEARRLLVDGPWVGIDRPGTALDGLARHWSLAPDPVFAAAVVPTIAALVPAIPRAEDGERARGLAALVILADLLAAAGESAGAADARAIAEPGGGDGSRGLVGELERLVASASATWTWADPDAGPAALISALRGVLLAESAQGLAFTPVVPDAWLGQGWEVHDAPTAHGLVSYAIRWHGDRPALLWDLAGRAGGPPIEITVPGLDPSWSTTESRGEALLAPVAVPERESRRRGLSIPVTIEPIRRPGR